MMMMMMMMIEEIDDDNVTQLSERLFTVLVYVFTHRTQPIITSIDTNQIEGCVLYGGG